MRKDIKNIIEDIASTSVANVQGLTVDPIGLKHRKFGQYKKDNEVKTLKKLKETLKEQHV